ncbi:MAG TPA: DUF4126 domain-containing protein, partial [Streptosporangiaceae bacterium]|nr:DUF4126 domain-containing protein [Streptosporangiaceae bacterium]
MSAVPLIFSSGWASGINSYAVVLLLGLLGRYAHMSTVPPTLERTDVLAVCAVLFLGQFVVGKIPYVDSVWDGIHTAIRPLMGAAVGVLMAGHAHTLPQAAAAALGGGAALVTHLVKTGVRVGVNASPEPVSNIVASLAEDLGVAGIVVLALLHPLVAALIAATLLVVGVVLVIMLAKRI